MNLIEKEQCISDRKSFLKILTALKKDYKVIGKTKDNIKNYNSLVKAIRDNTDVSINTDLVLSYSKNKSNPFDNRISTTFGRYVRRVLQIGVDKIDDTILSNISNALSEILSKPKDDEVEILSGQDLASFYTKTKIHSCMTGSSTRAKLYAENPNSIKLVVLKPQKARALLWICDDGTKILDRIYPLDGKYSAKLRAWATKNNIILKSQATQKFVTVTFDKIQLPYIDTFYHIKLDEEKKLIKLSNKHTGCKYIEDELPSDYNYHYNPFTYTFNICNGCKHMTKSSLKEIRLCDGKIIKLCSNCLYRYRRCLHCKYYYEYHFPHRFGDFCKTCAKKHAQKCGKCHIYFEKTQKFVKAKKYNRKNIIKICNNCTKNLWIVVGE